MSDKRVLKTIYALRLLNGRAPLDDVARRLGIDSRTINRELGGLRARELVDRNSKGWVLTGKGRRRLKVVFIGGTFEVVHTGHLYTIEQARRLGDLLVVVVARDATVRRRKGREPISPEAERIKLLASLRQVDVALLGVEGDIYETLEKVRPDVVALGYDQYHIEAEVASQGKKRGLRLKVVRLRPSDLSVKTSRILREF